MIWSAETQRIEYLTIGIAADFHKKPAGFFFAQKQKGGIREMAVFRVEKNSGYTVMSNHHLRNRALSLKAKGLLLPNALPAGRLGLHPARAGPYQPGKHRRDTAGHPGTGTGRIHPAFQRTGRERTAARCRLCDLRAAAAVPASVSPTLENPTLENPTQENPTLENPMQLNKDKLITEKQKKEGLNTDSIPIHSPNPLPLDEDEAAAPPPGTDRKPKGNGLSNLPGPDFGEHRV